VFVGACAALNDAGVWVCPSCSAGAALSTGPQFCAQCGEQRLPKARGTLWRRWLYTLRLLCTQPGQLTLDHANGKRQAQVQPLALFLAINVVFFVAQAFSGLNVLSIPLKAHLSNQGYSDWARLRLDQRMVHRKLSPERFEDRFNLQQETLAKATVLLMVPLFAAVSALSLSKHRRWLAKHWVFGLHFYAWLLLLLAVSFSLLGPSMRLLKHWGWEPNAANFDNLVSSLEGLAIATYLTLAIARAFAVRWWGAVAGAVVLTFTVLGALYLHRMAMLGFTAWWV
jgi:uncharacterized membrane protein